MSKEILINLKFMKKVEKSIDQIMFDLTPIEENQLGVLQGGFISFSITPEENTDDINVFSCGKTTNQCQVNTVAGCGGGTTPTPTPSPTGTVS